MIRKTSAILLSILLLSSIHFGCDNQRIVISKANELIRIGSFDQAISLLDQEIQDNPTNKAAHLAMANSYAGKYFAGREKELEKKAIDYYKSALTIDGNYLEAMHVYADFLKSVGATKTYYTIIREVERLDVGDKYIGSYLPSSDNKEKIATYFNQLNSSEVVNILPHENRGTFIFTKDVDGIVVQEGKETGSVRIEKNSVNSKFKIDGDKISYFYDKIEILGDSEHLYRLEPFVYKMHYKNGHWDGYHYGLLSPGDLGYQKRLYKRTLTAREQYILSGRKPLDNCGNYSCTDIKLYITYRNLAYLFTGKFINTGSNSINVTGNWNKKWNDQYKDHFLTEQIESVPLNNYRNVEDISDEKYTVKYTASNRGHSWLKDGKYGYIVATKVRAIRYIKTVDRFVSVSIDAGIFGSGSTRIDRTMIQSISNWSPFLDESVRSILLHQNVPVGFPFEIVRELHGHSLQLTRKTYVDGEIFESWIDVRTNKELIFKNSLLSRETGKSPL